MHISFFYIASFALAPIMALPTPSERDHPEELYAQILEDLTTSGSRQGHASQTPQDVDLPDERLGYEIDHHYGSGMTPDYFAAAQSQAGQPFNQPASSYQQMHPPHHSPYQHEVNYQPGNSQIHQEVDLRGERFGYGTENVYGSELMPGYEAGAQSKPGQLSNPPVQYIHPSHQFLHQHRVNYQPDNSQTPQEFASRNGQSGYGTDNRYGSGMMPAFLGAQAQAGQPSDPSLIPYQPTHPPHQFLQQQGVDYQQEMSLPRNWQTRPSGSHGSRLKSDQRKGMGFHPYGTTSLAPISSSGRGRMATSLQPPKASGSGSGSGYGQPPSPVTTLTFNRRQPQGEVVAPLGETSKRPKVRDSRTRERLERHEKYETQDPKKIRLHDIWFEIIYPDYWECTSKGPVKKDKRKLKDCYDNNWMGWEFINDNKCTQRFQASSPYPAKHNDKRKTTVEILCYIWEGDVLGLSIEQLEAIYRGIQTPTGITSY